MCIVSSVSVKETHTDRRGERVEGMQLAVGRSVTTRQDLTLCLMGSLLWGKMRTGSNRLTAVCTNFKLLAILLANTSVSCCKSSVTT